MKVPIIINDITVEIVCESNGIGWDCTCDDMPFDTEFSVSALNEIKNQISDYIHAGEYNERLFKNFS